MLKVAGISDIGSKRKVNQDHLFVDEELKLFIVADGMGGHKAGETASRVAVEEITRFFMREDEEEDKTPVELELDPVKMARRSLALSIEAANRKIFALSQENSEFRGMGTTVVACHIVDSTLVVAHVGDSRLYVLRDGLLTQLTKDHSRVQELIDQERITEQEAKKYPLRNVITRALGGDAEIEVDITTHQLASTDVWLLCSDGLSSVLDAELIKKVVLSYAGNPQAACDKLVELTKIAGAPDNITIVLIEGEDFGSEEGSSLLGEFSFYPEEEAAEPSPLPKKGFISSFMRRLGFKH